MAATAGATYTNDFIELYNPTASAISVTGKSVQYRSATGTGAAWRTTTALTGSVPAGGHYLIQEAAGTGGTDRRCRRRTPPARITMGGTGGQVVARRHHRGADPAAPATSTRRDIIDFVGAATTAAPTRRAELSANLEQHHVRRAQRDRHRHRQQRRRLHASGAHPGERRQRPAAPAGERHRHDRRDPGHRRHQPARRQDRHHAAASSPRRTRPAASTASTSRPRAPAARPTRPRRLRRDLRLRRQLRRRDVRRSATTSRSPARSASSPAAPSSPAPRPTITAAGRDRRAGHPARRRAYPTTEADREAHEGELLAPDRRLHGHQHLHHQPVRRDRPGHRHQAADRSRPRSPTPRTRAAIAAVVADNAARGVALDDGASVNFLSAANQGTPLPWLTPTNPVRVGAPATLPRARWSLDFRNSVWKFQPTSQVTDDGAGDGDLREHPHRRPPRASAATSRLATFNVLNYFNTTGEDYVAAGAQLHLLQRPRGQPGHRQRLRPDGPRGAAEADDLSGSRPRSSPRSTRSAPTSSPSRRSRTRSPLGETDRDDALADAGRRAEHAPPARTRWAFAPSPAAADLPAVAEQDVIRTRLHLQARARSTLVGASKVLVGSAAFANAREPLAQAFKPVGRRGRPRRSPSS